MTRQQQAAYEAQRRLCLGPIFAGLVEAQTYCDNLTAQAWWGQRYPSVVRLEVTAITSARVCGVGTADRERNCGVIGLTNVGMNERVILHEAAHCIAGDAAGHEWPWARAYLELVYLVRGSEDYQALRESFLEHGVRIDEELR